MFLCIDRYAEEAVNLGGGVHRLRVCSTLEIGIEYDARSTKSMGISWA